MFRKILFILMFSSMSVLLLSCSHNDNKFLQKDYFFQNNGITVASCPNGVYILVNGMECVTPCFIEVPDNTGVIKLEHGDNIGYVPLNRSGYHGYEVTGTLVIPNVDQIGLTSDSPLAPFFVRDTSLGLTDMCGYEGTK